MELTDFKALYRSEAEELLRQLGIGLLSLGTSPQAVEEVFRAAHNLKGMAAAMGFPPVERLAHELEDRLEELRSGRRVADDELTDGLLALLQRLEAEVGRSVSGRPGAAAAGTLPADVRRSGQADLHAGGAASIPAGPPSADSTAQEACEQASEAECPAGAEWAVVIRLRRDTPLPGARAFLIREAVRAAAELLGSSPADPVGTDTYTLRLYFGAGCEPEVLERVIRASGDVAELAWEPVMRLPRLPVAVAEEGPLAGTSPTVRVEQRRLNELATGMAELAILQRRVSTLVAAGQSDAAATLLTVLGRLVDALQQGVLATSMVPASEAFDRFPRVVREAARSLGKQVEFGISGGDVRLDRSVLEALVDPLTHLLRNAVDHGIEPSDERQAKGKDPAGALRLSAEREPGFVRLEVWDDGGGVPADRVRERALARGLSLPAGELSADDLLRLLTLPGFSTAPTVTDLSGRGVGLDVVSTRVRALGGSLELETLPGAGTTWRLRVPITLSAALALRVRLGEEQYAVPLPHIDRAVMLDGAELLFDGGRECVRCDGELLPLVRLSAVLGLPESGGESVALVTGIGDRRAAIAVDDLLGREQIIVKPIDAPTGLLPIFSGAAVLMDGYVALVVDPLSVL